MEENIQKIFKEQYDKLPPELQKAITASDIRVKLASLTQKYRLHIDKATILENEVVLVLMGMENPDEFVNNARNQLGISPEDARALARDVNDQIFHPIREKLESFVNSQMQTYAEEHPEVLSPVAADTPAPISTFPGKTPGVKTAPSADRYREPVDDAIPQAAVTPAPSVPKNIIAEKLTGLSLGKIVRPKSDIDLSASKPVLPLAAPQLVEKSPVPTLTEAQPTPILPPTSPMQGKKVEFTENKPTEPASISLKSFGIQIGGEKKTESKLPIPDGIPAQPSAPALKEEAAVPKPAPDPYRENI